MASEEKKPNGFFVIPNEEFFRQLIIYRPIRVLPGIGPKTADHLKHYHLNTIRDLLNWSEASLQKLLGVSGLELYRAARGIDDRPVLHLGDGEAKSNRGANEDVLVDVTHPLVEDEDEKYLYNIYLLSANNNYVFVQLSVPEYVNGTKTQEIFGKIINSLEY